MQVEAEFVGVKDGVVRLRKPDGKIATVPLDKLSPQDQEFVNSGGVEKAPQAPATPEPAAEAGDKNTAARFDEAIRNNPNDANAYYGRGLARMNQDMAQEAMADLQKAIELDPKLAVAYDARGTIHSKMGDAAKAQEDFNRAIELDPELASAYKHRGENLAAFYKTPQGKVDLGEELEKFRKKYHAVAGDNRRKTPWQPLNNTTGNVSAPRASCSWPSWTWIVPTNWRIIGRTTTATTVMAGTAAPDAVAARAPVLVLALVLARLPRPL